MPMTFILILFNEWVGYFRKKKIHNATLYLSHYIGQTYEEIDQYQRGWIFKASVYSLMEVVPLHLYCCVLKRTYNTTLLLILCLLWCCIQFCRRNTVYMYAINILKSIFYSINIYRGLPFWHQSKHMSLSIYIYIYI